MSALIVETPKNPAFEADIRSHLDTSPVLRFFGFVFDSVDPGAVTLSANLRPELGHRSGYFQGAIMGAIADYSGSFSNMTLQAPAWICLTLDYTIKFLAPAEGERLIARGRTISAGRTVCVAKSDIFVVRSGGEILCATALITTRHAPAQAEAR